VSDILKYLFPVPKPDSQRVVTFSNEQDLILFRHHTFTTKGKEVTLKVSRFKVEQEALSPPHLLALR
jgi:rRNA maturation protein Rpf1